MSSEALKRANQYIDAEALNVDGGNEQAAAIMDALLAEVARLEQANAKFHEDAAYTAEIVDGEVRKLEADRDFWKERYETQHRTLHKMEDALAEAREKARLLEAALAVERGHFGDEYARERVSRLEQERDEARKERDARRERKIVVEELGAELAEARKREQRRELALKFILQEAKDGRIEVERGVNAAPTFWLEAIEKRARAALVDEPAAATCPECGSEMGEVRSYHTGVCPHHGVQPAAATLAEPEARVQGTEGTPPASARTDGPGSASAAADEPADEGFDPWGVGPANVAAADEPGETP